MSKLEELIEEFLQRLQDNDMEFRERVALGRLLDALITEARRVALSKAIEVCSGLSDGIECVNAIEALLPSEVKP